MKLKHKLICLDLETTDLDSNLGSIIQIGAVIVNQEFKLEKNNEFDIYIKPLTKHRNFEAMKVNNISEDTLQSAIELNDALELFENFCRKNKYLAAWGNYFDIPFLQKQYKKINRSWPFSHVSIDLKSIATWELAKQNITTTGLEKTASKMNLTFETNAHHALSDIKMSVNILIQLLKENSNELHKGW